MSHKLSTIKCTHFLWLKEAPLLLAVKSFFKQVTITYFSTSLN